MVGDLYWAIIIAAKEFEESRGVLKFLNLSCREVEIGWVSPEVGWVKLNVDEACRNDGKIAGCGGLIHDSSGNWVIGFNMKPHYWIESHLG